MLHQLLFAMSAIASGPAVTFDIDLPSGLVIEAKSRMSLAFTTPTLEHKSMMDETYTVRVERRGAKHILQATPPKRTVVGLPNQFNMEFLPLYGALHTLPAIRFRDPAKMRFVDRKSAIKSVRQYIGAQQATAIREAVAASPDSVMAQMAVAGWEWTGLWLDGMQLVPGKAHVETGPAGSQFQAGRALIGGAPGPGSIVITLTEQRPCAPTVKRQCNVVQRVGQFDPQALQDFAQELNGIRLDSVVFSDTTIIESNGQTWHFEENFTIVASDGAGNDVTQNLRSVTQFRSGANPTFEPWETYDMKDGDEEFHVAVPSVPDAESLPPGSWKAPTAQALEGTWETDWDCSKRLAEEMGRYFDGKGPASLEIRSDGNFAFHHPEMGRMPGQWALNDSVLSVELPGGRMISFLAQMRPGPQLVLLQGDDFVFCHGRP